ncbi:MAG TPA: hypothetical protein VMU41_00140 [Candidatus Binataceae bacterium]|nr:hypothetical protein [Candidatus Binataceae bacterium]
MTLTDKQRKYAWIAAVVLVLYFAPAVLRQVMMSMHRTPSIAKPRAARPISSTPLIPKTVSPSSAGLQGAAADGPDADPVAAAFFRGHLGTYMGAGMIPNRGICRLVLELKLDPEKPGFYTGYSTMSCGPSGPFVKRQPGMNQGAAEILNEMTPTSAILSGHVVQRSIPFEVQQAIGKSPDGCGITSYKATPFGTSAIAVEWTEGSCYSGQMILARKS